ncbi:MAG TPA: sugar isomerase domain-containing protein [Bacillota bacterium]
MLIDKYFSNMKEVLNRIEATQTGRIKDASGMIVSSLKNGGAVHLLDTGHMLSHEVIGRAGGLMLITPINIGINIDNPARIRKGQEKKQVFWDEIEGLPGYILNKSKVFAGDVLIIASVSGKNVLPVETALQARTMGVKTIAITSVEYSRNLKSAHSSGKLLFEAADLVLDNCCPYGDAVVGDEKLQVKICPGSGIAGAYLMWALTAQITEDLMNSGVKPSIYMSNHLEGADEANRGAMRVFQETGF